MRVRSSVTRPSVLIDPPALPTPNPPLSTKAPSRSVTLLAWIAPPIATGLVPPSAQTWHSEKLLVERSTCPSESTHPPMAMLPLTRPWLKDSHLRVSVPLPLWLKMRLSIPPCKCAPFKAFTLPSMVRSSCGTTISPLVREIRRKQLAVCALTFTVSPVGSGRDRVAKTAWSAVLTVGYKNGGCPGRHRVPAGHDDRTKQEPLPKRR